MSEINEKIKRAAKINLINMKKLALMKEVYKESNRRLNNLIGEKTNASIVQDYDDSIRIDIHCRDNGSYILGAKQLAELEDLTEYTFSRTLDTPGYYIFDKPEISYPVEELEKITKRIDEYIGCDNND